MTTFKVFSIGSINIDDVYRLPHIVAPGETTAAVAKATFPGGKGANQSVAVARGLSPGDTTAHTVYHVGMINPADGQWIVDLMHQSGVCTDLITSPLSTSTSKQHSQQETGTGRAIIQVASSSGENAIILYPGTNHLLDPTLHFPSPAHFADVDHAVFVFQNEISNGPAFVRMAHQFASQRNPAGRPRGTVVFNPSPCTPTLAHEFDLTHVDVLLVNEGELDALTESLGLAGGDWQTKLAALLARFPTMAVAIVTLGAKGAGVLAQGHPAVPAQQPTLVPSLRVQPVDTTGAGDTFAGFLVAQLVRQRVVVADLLTTDRQGVWDKVLAAVKVAAAAAAMACEREGAMSGIPLLEEVLERIGSPDQH